MKLINRMMLNLQTLKIVKNYKQTDKHTYEHTLKSTNGVRLWTDFKTNCMKQLPDLGIPYSKTQVSLKANLSPQTE